MKEGAYRGAKQASPYWLSPEVDAVESLDDPVEVGVESVGTSVVEDVDEVSEEASGTDVEASSTSGAGVELGRVLINRDW